MIKKLIRYFSFIFLSIFISSCSLFSGIFPAQALQTDTDTNVENSIGIVIVEKSNDLDGSKSSSEPDLGDDQAFPFIPGFGKNSGKDW